ncbi:transcription termination factor Rho [Mycobacterium sp. SM1]|uniref:transcription termination factor Rho n=1 Tax=Mycobacterium sp. SM1 TaxID=2816243 RepID=UPI001BCCC85E|nr:transcription termination factor Rho [Mycobacterium sp. SM1]MBS4727307.1 transcription termination factor Rho [Mycobacterium sp. SM1]
MTETDLITAGDSTEKNRLSNSVITHTSELAPSGAEAPMPVGPGPALPGTDTPTLVEASISSDGSLAGMVLPELRALATRAGVKGTSGMRKSELIAAIRESQQRADGAQPRGEAPAQDRGARDDAGGPTGHVRTEAVTGAPESAGGAGPREAEAPSETADKDSDQGGDQQGEQQARGDEDVEGRQGRRGRRFRDRRRRGERSADNADAELREDDIIQPVAGVLDVLDNYAFVRTSGYLAGPHDVYVSMNMVRKYGLRRGDAVTGAVRLPREGEQPNQRQKFNPLVRLDSVNGGPVEDAKKRPEFGKLTPLYPNQRLRLETTSDKLTTRVIDLIMPIGKGQRALIVSPPKAGKTTILKDIANAITTNNPECHLMVVLVDERPEEVTDMQRSVKGEVIASTFDRPPSDHTSVAELATERAKRLVEQGKDVVVLLDSITRLGRAYNNASPASGRILSGGVDSTALYPPKRFLGAARNIEEGGSLTVIATAMVETGSQGDTVIFEEFKGTGNAELKLDRKIAERRVFPAVDVNPSGTRKDELLLSPDEFAVVHKLRRLLSGLDSHQAIDLLISQLRKTKNNYEFLMQVSKTAPGGLDND